MLSQKGVKASIGRTKELSMQNSIEKSIPPQKKADTG